MRKNIGSADLGSRGTITIWTEDKWIYPEIVLEGREGETAVINLQHTTVENLHKFADEMKRIAFELEKESE